MPTVKFTYALRRFFPGLKNTEVSSENLPDLLHRIETHYPGIRSYVVDERGALRKHVLIFIDGEQISDRKTLTDKIGENSEVYIMQSLSGG